MMMTSKIRNRRCSHVCSSMYVLGRQSYPFLRRWTNPAWTRGRVAGLPPGGLSAALLTAISAPIVEGRIARQAATETGEGNDGPGAAGKLASIDVSDPHLYQDDNWRPLFAQLRRDDPVHYCEASPFGPYWSVTRYDDIFAVELDHENYSSSSELGGIQITDQPLGPGVCQLYPDGPAGPYRASPHRRADRGAVQPRQPRGADPQAHLGRARRAAAQRDV